MTVCLHQTSSMTRATGKMPCILCVIFHIQYKMRLLAIKFFHYAITRHCAHQPKNSPWEGIVRCKIILQWRGQSAIEVGSKFENLHKSRHVNLLSSLALFFQNGRP